MRKSKDPDNYVITQHPYTPAEIARFMEEKSKLSSLRKFLEKVLGGIKRTSQ